MTLKMYQIIDFPAFYEKVKSQKLSFKVAYRLSMLAQEIEKHLNFYQESFRGLLMEYGQKDAEGNLIPTSDNQGILLVQETTQEAYQKLGELRDLDIEMPDIKFSIEDFNNVELSADEVYLIIPFIED